MTGRSDPAGFFVQKQLAPFPKSAFFGANYKNYLVVCEKFCTFAAKLMFMINIQDPYQCCGCTACASKCAQNAIKMRLNALGFAYPSVDLNLCTDCGLCESVCAFNNHYERNTDLAEPRFYAARLKNEEALKHSQSGGAFMAIAENVISQRGVVYGVGYGEHFRVEHQRATTLEECKAFRGSKYVQSDLGDVFTQIKKDLISGLPVLFVGTPCQVAGLKSCINKKYRNQLLLVDIVCHGVPSPKVWDEYLSFMETKKNDKLIDVVFRDKERYGWKGAKATYRFSKHPNKVVSFLSSYYRPVLMRPSCSACPFVNTERPGDLTIGDFWSAKQISSLNQDNKGCSLIIANSSKGQTILEKLQKHMNIVSVSREDAMQYNLQFRTPEDVHRKSFEIEYTKNGFLPAMRKYHDLGWKKQIRLYMGHIKRILAK